MEVQIPKLGERLWPEESEQPTRELLFNGESFVLTWANTWIQIYRTGNKEFDEELKQYDHVLHKYAEDEDGKFDFIVLTFEQIGPECTSFLIQNGYPHHVDPIPDNYVLSLAANKEADSIPEAIGPDFGTLA